MEKFELTLQSQPAVDSYLSTGCITRHERALLAEISAAIAAGDIEQLNWITGLGDSFHRILLNVNEYRHALEFGFTEIAFDQYGWFASPKFLEFECIKLEESDIRIGRGPNGSWAYALRCNYGVAGESCPLSVFCKKYPSREAALSAALDEVKAKMSKYIGNVDCTNFKQDVLIKTLKAVATQQNGLVQLSLF